MTEEKSSVKDKKSLDEWHMHHHNKFIKSKIDSGSPAGFSFPPPYNFIEKDDIQINNIGDNTAEIEVSTRFGNYVFNVEDGSNDNNDYGMIIESIYMKPQWGGNLIKILG
ncbi:MAG TPA: hypothetical protein PLC90_13895 [Bacteroidales bacterium]|nr:hypothetical protein [Bacteroidales bacterium]HPI31407.1 hypothetical protein [Bacteroidales bacterium]HQN17431.1 hypothetical protein [Bacteroidales bacterium]